MAWPWLRRVYDSPNMLPYLTSLKHTIMSGMWPQGWTCYNTMTALGFFLGVPNLQIMAAENLAVGLTGTRCTTGRPQMRWSDGVTLASSLASARQNTVFGGHVLSISSMFRETALTVRSFLNGGT